MRYCRKAVIGLLSTILVPSQVSAQGGPSFDCKTDRGRTEQAICANSDLRQMDLTMAKLYFSVQADNTRRRYRRLKRDQVEWLAERNACGANVRCLRRAYADRIKELEDALAAD